MDEPEEIAHNKQSILPFKKLTYERQNAIRDLGTRYQC